MELSDLNLIGLTKGEVKIYSALLELGETTRTPLAKKSGVSPSKIYDVTNRLLEKGIISSVRKNGVLHFSAANPERIKDFIEQKEQDIAKERKIVDGILPILFSRYNQGKGETDIEVFYGWNGMKTAYWDIGKSIPKNGTVHIMGASLGEDQNRSKLFFLNYYRNVDKYGYKIKIIFNENAIFSDHTDYFIKSKLHETRFLYQDTFAEMTIYGESALLTLLLKRPVVIRINNKDVASSMIKYFNTLWKHSIPKTTFLKEKIKKG